MESNNQITLNDLIIEGQNIRKDISYVDPPSHIMRMYDVYRFSDNQKYEIWKNKCLRFLSREFNGDRCIKDFEETIKEMTVKNYPTYMDRLIGILQSCTVVSKIKNDTISESNHPTHIFNINQNQSQSQEIAINIFLDAIKDELTGRQIKEIQEICNNNKNLQKAKNKIIDKLNSFGENVLSNIIANLITNPSIWNHF